MAEGILNPIPQLQADFDFDVYTKQEVDTLLDGKADKVDTYTKTETDALLDDKADADAVYTKIETDTLLSAKADKSTTLAGYGITDAYTKTQTDNLLNGKADTNSVYTKEETDNLLSVKANSADVYTKIESNTLLAGKASADDVYTKTEIDNQLTVTKDGTWVKGTQTTAINLEKLEGGIEYLYGLLSYKYSQLRKYINGNYYDYETDTDSAYTKTVPAGAMPYAGIEKLGGKTLVWNQAEPVISSADWEQYASTYTSVSFSDGVATVTVINDSSSSGYHYGFGRKTAHSIISGHVYIFLYDIRSNNAGTSFSDETISTNGGFTNVATNANQWYSFCSIQTANKSTTKCLIKPLNNRTGLIFDVRNVMLIDLTLLYGSGNEPSTVEQFREMFPADYYEYNSGELLSAGVTEVVSKKADTTEIATYSIPAEIQALEGYGWSAGSVYNYIDYERKVFVQNVGRVDLGTMTYTYDNTANRNYFYTDSLQNVIKPTAGKSAIPDLISPLYNCVTWSSAYNATSANMSISQGKLNGEQVNIQIKNLAYTDATTFKSAMSGVYLYYALATPIETDISQYLTDDNLIEVEANGTLTFPNNNGTDYQIPVPSKETYMIDLQEAINNG